MSTQRCAAAVIVIIVTVIVTITVTVGGQEVLTETVLRGVECSCVSFSAARA